MYCIKHKGTNMSCSLPSPQRFARWYIFKPKIPIWVYFEAFEWKRMIYFLASWNFYVNVAFLMEIWRFLCCLVYFSCFVILCQEKSGSPDLRRCHYLTSMNINLGKTFPLTAISRKLFSAAVNE
jgi:hypothetical protein